MAKARLFYNNGRLIDTLYAI